MKLQLLDIILIVLFFQLLTLFPYLIFQKTNRGISNKVLGLFLLAKALCITNFLSFRLWDFTMTYFPHAFYFGTSFTILWGPLLYIYVKSIAQPELQLKGKLLLHFVPFLAYFLLITFSFHIKSDDAIRNIMNHGGLFPGKFWPWYHKILYAYTFAYVMLAMPIVKQYQVKIRNNYSSINAVTLNWMYFILSGFTLKIMFDVWFSMSPYGSLSSTTAIYLSRLTLFLFINIMIYKGLKQPYIWLGQPDNEKEKKPSLSKTSQETYLEKLINFTKKYKPYLNPDLTLEELSHMVKIPPRSLSAVLNEGLNQNFYDFINSYRIKESEQILNSSPHEKTVLEVLYEVGFNSKSSFNTAFKKFNGMTPTQYKKHKSLQLN